MIYKGFGNLLTYFEDLIITSFFIYNIIDIVEEDTFLSGEESTPLGGKSKFRPLIVGGKCVFYIELGYIQENAICRSPVMYIRSALVRFIINDTGNFKLIDV